MARIVHGPPGNLNSDEWTSIEEALAVEKYATIVSKLRALKNEPTAAEDILPEKLVNGGHDYVNVHLRRRDVPFRLSRIGAWWEEKEKHRDKRLLAFVRWS